MAQSHRIAAERPGDAGLTAAAVGAAVVVAAGVTLSPWTASGLLLGAALVALILVRPLVVLGGLLAIGAVDLSLLTGGYKALPVVGGGLDMNGIRLAGVVAGFGALALVERDMLRHALAPYGRWFLAFLAFAAATAVYSPSLVEATRMLFKLAFPFVVFLAVLAFARSRGDVDRLADWALGAAAVLALVVNPLLVLFGSYHIGWDGRLRVSGLGLDSTVFAWYMLAMLLLAFGRFATRGQLRYLLLAGVFVAWIVLTVTRTAVPAIAVGVGGMALLSAVVTRDYRPAIAAAALGGVLLVFMVPAVLDRSLGYVPAVGELWLLVRDPGALVDSVAWLGRETVWPLLLQQVLASPLLGQGLGASNVFMATYFPEWLVAHNEYLRLGMDTGLIGAGLFAAAAGAWLVAVLRVARSGAAGAREYALPAFGAILAWAVIAFTDNAFDYYAQYTQFVGFFCAAALVAGRYEE